VRTPLELLRQVADRAAEHPYTVWRFGEAIAMEGLLEAAELTGVSFYRERVGQVMDGWINARSELVTEDHTAGGTALVRLWELTGEPRYLERARLLADLLTHAPLHPNGVHLHVRDGEGWKPFAWVDCMHTDAPFLAALGRATGDFRYFDAAVDLMTMQLQAFQDPMDGLFSHGFDCEGGGPQGVRWGQGNGWALLGLLETVRSLPEAHRSVLVESLQQGAAAVMSLQLPDGQFRTVIDDPAAPVEFSVAAFMAVILLEGARLGFLRKEAAQAGELAWWAVERSADAHGRLETSVATAASPDPVWYHTRPTEASVPWGQGPLMLACAAMVRRYGSPS
jgi:unsaturated rhamnogalacturonyl hydrolase